MSIIGSIDLKDGGSFISDDEKITPHYLPNAVESISLFVNFTSKKYTKFDDSVYDCIPANIIDFTYGSRFDTWSLLVKRFICHTIDILCESLVHSKMDFYHKRNI